MVITKRDKTASAVLYCIGAFVVLCLVALSIFGSYEPIFPQSMLSLSWKEMPFICLAVGTLPMLWVCGRLYMDYDMRNSRHKKRNMALVFLPCFVCAAYIVFIIGFILFAIKTLSHF